MTGVDAVRCGCGGPFVGCTICTCGVGWAFTPLTRDLFIAATSIDCDRGPDSVFTAGSDFGCSAWLVVPQCWARRERLSSIGVKILCCLADAGRGFGCGKGGL